MTTPSVVEVAQHALLSALRDVVGVRAYDDVGANIDPPATLVGPPRLTWGAMTSAPNEAQFIVFLIAPANDRALSLIWSLLPEVIAAIDSVPDAVVKEANPGVWRAGGSDLPCYEIQCEVAL